MLMSYFMGYSPNVAEVIMFFRRQSYSDCFESADVVAAIAVRTHHVAGKLAQ